MPRIYVGTYAKYNNGSISGNWLDLDAYNNRFDFMQACAVLHSDEHDPELMFQDWEGIPDKFIGESHLAENTWPDWVDKDEDTRARYQMAWGHIDSDLTPEEIDNRYAGEFGSEDDWAYDFWHDTGMLKDIPEFAQCYINFESYARDCRLNGEVTFVHELGKVHVFMNN